METVLGVKNLSVIKGHQKILDDISFSQQAGSILGLLGPSGCGKTTLMRSILGLQKISSGALEVLGTNPDDVAIRSKIGYVSQEASVYHDMSVEGNVRYFAQLYGTDDIEEVLQAVDLLSQRKQMVHSLSGGQRNRVSLACVLVAKPQLLIMDEPTVGLDSVLRVQLWELFTELKNNGITLLVSSHVMDEANHCDDLLLMRTGKILSQGSPHDILEQTSTSTIEQAFLEIIKAGAS